MVALALQLDAIKGALASGVASSTTVSDLQRLFTTEKPTATAPTKPKARVTSKPTLSKRPAPRDHKFVDVHEDVVETLPVKALYALATEVVNTSLKTLTSAAKSRQQPLNSVSNSLQPRSPNSAPISPKVRGKVEAHSPLSSALPESGILATAECARLAFAHLRSNSAQKLCPKNQPKWQLETGMFALASRLVTLGLESLAVKELRILKRRLQSKSFGNAPLDQATKLVPAEQPERETLASLVQVELSSSDDQEALGLAISLQLLMLKIVSISRKPSIIETTLNMLRPEQPGSPSELMMKQAALPGNETRSAKQLEMLAQHILSLCPGASTSCDEIALDTSLSPSPAVVFELQVLALRTRKQWWKLADHRSDFDKELLEPFSRSLAALVRRTARSACDVQTYDLVEKSYALLDLGTVTCASELCFDICTSIATLAERCGKADREVHWVHMMDIACSPLDQQHARRIACVVRRCTLVAGQSFDPALMMECHATISERLRGKVTGHSGDYDLLLCELARLIGTFGGSPPEMTSVIFMAAGFAQRYERSYPRRNTALVLTILQAALRQSKTSEDMLKWVTEDAMRAFMHAGILQVVTDAATRLPSADAWSSSAETVALDRVLQTVVLRYLKQVSNDASLAILDDQSLPNGQRGTLVEEQLRHALDLLGRSKYRSALQKLVPDLLRKLSKLYTPSEFPVRRKRFATLALSLRESHPTLVPPHAIKVWLDEAKNATEVLGEDVGLQCFAADIEAGWMVARAFNDTKPTLVDLEPSLLTWQRILEDPSMSIKPCAHIYDSKSTSGHLTAIATYFGALGEDNSRLRVLRLLLQQARLSDSGGDFEAAQVIQLSRMCIDMDYAEQAGALLSQTRIAFAGDRVSVLHKIELALAHAELHLATEHLDSARVDLERAKELRATVGPEGIATHERRAYELLHARAWIMESAFSMKMGVLKGALVAAKRAVRLLNATWTAIEHSNTNGDTSSSMRNELPEASEPETNTLSSGVSKLRLNLKASSESTSSAVRTDKGASFWMLVPLLCRAMMHLSDMYAHNGLFAEANYYSERAVKIAESVQSAIWLSRVQTHRSKLIMLAGRLEDAELCLTRAGERPLDGSSLATVEYHCAKAELRTREESYDDAIKAYKQAADIIQTLQSTNSANESDGSSVVELELSEQMRSMSLTSRQSNDDCGAPIKTTKGRKVQPKAAARVAQPASNRVVSKRPGATSQKAKPTLTKQCHLLDKLLANINIECAIVSVRAGHKPEALATLPYQSLGSVQRLQSLEYQTLMRRVAVAVQSDVSYNSLPESTLTFPALLQTSSIELALTSPVIAHTVKLAPKSRKAPVKTKVQQRVPDDRVDNLLLRATECLATSRSTCPQSSSTADLHSSCSYALCTTMLLSAVGSAPARSALHPAKTALYCEVAKNEAMQREYMSIAVDDEQSDGPSPFTWPSSEHRFHQLTQSDSQFQQEYLDILPKKWTALSINLSDDSSELHVARYRSGQSPLILRLPFSRHKPDDPNDDEAFDYHAGKAEIQNIIEVSNYSCHNSGNVDGKGAKSNWWAQREALDRRLHELLVNIENIWFGGFRGIFSLLQERAESLAQFRKSFEDILSRYLPSRQSVKAKGKPLELDDHVLELFIGLGSDEDGVVDLDEPLSDLLYYVVDTLQFAGERNAYDEIDFDGMAVDVLDALRSYHEDVASGNDEDRHLILVLDKRLQAFPWESLPRLEGSSVSRMNSMLGLRERILSMRQQRAACDRHVVSRKSGTYILNPSKDLASTQTTLAPSLESLGTAEGTAWCSMIRQEPDEDELRTALTESPIMLYFGHGGGSQYIRPRTIRRLDKCSEVVWLMGCSSGAVTEHGELEPSAVPFAYLMAGGSGDAIPKSTTERTPAKKCMAVVATLWDVTDKDIDRFSLAMGEAWGLWPSSAASKLPAKTPRKREKLSVVPTTPQRAPKTPKRSKTPAAAAKTPARSRSRPGDDDRKCSLVEAVAKSRDACYLRYLNGAAVVAYGVPVWLGD
ncbi:separin protein [Elasticomyces elasticus]|nr:separin protein [Elasticomyces elasticus]KAK3656108.1 separin protein [Elasticomyces elasticus]KAK4922337.1 separin protein [Elasticomyces elasticus]KAK5763791.1 separin protein [Elasticomyces elasticus]